jgi:predicted transposase/invertase (TIGR01784 family)
MSSPHDALFKAVFGQPEHARGALGAALSPVVRDALDWPSLARAAGSFIDPELAASHTDLLFSARWRDGGDALVYLVFEHQSSSDARMAFRLLRYLVRIWERWSADHPAALKLPAIVPVVLYHGHAGWSAPLAFEDLIDVPPSVRSALAPHLVRLAYLVDDLSEIPDEALRARAMTALGRLVELSFKHARTAPDLPRLLTSWGDVMHDVLRAANGLEALVLVMRYILLVNDHVEPEAAQALLDRVAGPDAKDAIMTAGERLLLQGEERGLKKGLEQGIQQGERSLLLRQLRKRFAQQVTAETAQRVEAASNDEISAWADRVLDARTLDEVLGD